jgi:predicted  nucleic acid-binding Zn-ribbon protein
MKEEPRYALHERLETVLGATEANTLMEHLPPTTWNDLVRQRDIDSMRIAMGSDMERLRGDLRGEMANLSSELRGEMAELRSELRGEMAELRSELRGEMAELRSEMTGLRLEMHHEIAQLRSEITHEMDKRFSKQLWQLITTSIGLQAMTIAAVGIMFANMN